MMQLLKNDILIF